MRTDPSQRMVDGVNPIQDPPTPTLRGRWLLAARTGWAAMLFALTLVTGAGFSMRADTRDRRAEAASGALEE